MPLLDFATEDELAAEALGQNDDGDYVLPDGLVVQWTKGGKVAVVGRWDPVLDVAGEGEGEEEDETEPKHQFAEPAPGDPNRPERGNWEKATNAYQEALTGAYDDWTDKTVKALRRGLRDKVDAAGLSAILDGRLEDLDADLTALGRKHLLEAFRAGRKGAEPSPADLSAVAAKIAENETFIRESLIPDARLHLERVIAEDLLKDDATTRQVFGALRSRVGSYAGAYWNTIFEAVGVGRQEREAEALKANEKPPRIMWVLDPRAQHCLAGAGTFGCIELGGKVWDSWDNLPTIPAGAVSCRGNCRCSLDEEQADGSWRRIA